MSVCLQRLCFVPSACVCECVLSFVFVRIDKFFAGVYICACVCFICVCVFYACAFVSVCASVEAAQ
jgi:hypothetical protein